MFHQGKQTYIHLLIRVAEYLRKNMGTQKQAAEIFGITERGVNKIWSLYKTGGKRALYSKKRGVQGGMKLKKDQAYKVRQLIKDKLPEQLKLPFGFGIELSRWQVGRYLKKWGYTPQKPIKKAFEQKPENVKKWLEEQYPAIQQKAKAEKRYTVNMISAISNRGHLQFMLMDKGFNSEVFKTFLNQMIKYSKTKVFFITDNHPAHKTIKLNQWLEENKEKLEVFFIPPYSPELNPQEYVNQDLKTNIIGKKRAINKEHFDIHL